MSAEWSSSSTTMTTGSQALSDFLRGGGVTRSVGAPDGKLAAVGDAVAACSRSRW